MPVSLVTPSTRFAISSPKRSCTSSSEAEVSSTVSCSSAAHSVSVSRRSPAQTLATPTGWLMKSSPDLRRWSAWCSHANTKAWLTASRSTWTRGLAGVLLDDREQVAEQLRLALGQARLGDRGVLDLRVLEGADGPALGRAALVGPVAALARAGPARARLARRLRLRLGLRRAVARGGLAPAVARGGLARRPPWRSSRRSGRCAAQPSHAVLVPALVGAEGRRALELGAPRGGDGDRAGRPGRRRRGRARRGRAGRGRPRPRTAAARRRRAATPRARPRPRRRGRAGPGRGWRAARADRIRAHGRSWQSVAQGARTQGGRASRPGPRPAGARGGRAPAGRARTHGDSGSAIPGSRSSAAYEHSAKPPSRPASARARRRASAHTTSTGSPEATSAPRQPAIPRSRRSCSARRGIADRGRPRLERGVELGQRRGHEVGRLAQHARSGRARWRGRCAAAAAARPRRSRSVG